MSLSHIIWTNFFTNLTLKSFIDPGLCWQDLKWFKSITKSEYTPHVSSQSIAHSNYSAPHFERRTNMGGQCSPPLLHIHNYNITQDALEAYDQNMAGVVLSNHGGRQLDFARSGIEVLVEVVTKLKEQRGLTFPNDKFHVFVDGGVRRATDVLKAVALGATAGE